MINKNGAKPRRNIKKQNAKIRGKQQINEGFSLLETAIISQTTSYSLETTDY
jgi:hypothetical protein